MPRRFSQPTFTREGGNEFLETNAHCPKCGTRFRVIVEGSADPNLTGQRLYNSRQTAADQFRWLRQENKTIYGPCGHKWQARDSTRGKGSSNEDVT